LAREQTGTSSQDNSCRRKRRDGYVTVDSAKQSAYVLEPTHTAVIDTIQAQPSPTFRSKRNAHGVAISPTAGRGFISDMAAGNGRRLHRHLDLNTFAVLGLCTRVRCRSGLSSNPARERVLARRGPRQGGLRSSRNLDPKAGKNGRPRSLSRRAEFSHG